jgi:hypothetical protein
MSVPRAMTDGETIMRKDTEIYPGAFEGTSQLDPADSLVGEIGEDPLEAGYSPPDHEPASARADARYSSNSVETLDQRLAEEEPDVTESDIASFYAAPRAGRLVADDRESGVGGDQAAAVDAGFAGWAASAEEAAMHIVED